MKLEDLRNKYPKRKNLKYEPKTNCKICKGSGEKFNKHLNDNTPCVCTQINHECCENVAESLSLFAKKNLNKISEKEYKEKLDRLW